MSKVISCPVCNENLIESENDTFHTCLFCGAVWDNEKIIELTDQDVVDCSGKPDNEQKARKP